MEGGFLPYGVIAMHVPDPTVEQEEKWEDAGRAHDHQRREWEIPAKVSSILLEQGRAFTVLYRGKFLAFTVVAE